MQKSSAIIRARGARPPVLRPLRPCQLPHGPRPASPAREVGADSYYAGLLGEESQESQESRDSAPLPSEESAGPLPHFHVGYY